MGRITRRKLIEELVDAKHDLKELGERYKLRVDELAEWANEKENARVLSGFCFLADMQTQLMLSRYRLLAADRLIRLATQDSEETSSEVARKACIDLLKMDLKRTEGKAIGLQDGGRGSEDEKGSADLLNEGLIAVHELREALYGK